MSRNKLKILRHMDGESCIVTVSQDLGQVHQGSKAGEFSPNPVRGAPDGASSALPSSDVEAHLALESPSCRPPTSGRRWRENAGLHGRMDDLGVHSAVNSGRWAVGSGQWAGLWPSAVVMLENTFWLSCSQGRERGKKELVCWIQNSLRDLYQWRLVPGATFGQDEMDTDDLGQKTLGGAID